jgi:hypothetical protein
LPLWQWQKVQEVPRGVKQMASNRLVLELIDRMSELLDQNAKMVKPKGTFPSYVEFTQEQWEAYDQNRKELNQLLRELRGISR